VKPAELDFQAILRALAAHKVDFIVVGGVCGALHGATLTTFDVDIVHSRQPENLERLLKALDALRARYRTPGKSTRTPDLSHLAADGHQLLKTKSGALDLLGTIGHGHSYDDLLPESKLMNIGKGLKVRVLDLPALIRIKEETVQEKDKLALMILRRTLEEKLRK
jgi:hypothetical protein